MAVVPSRSRAESFVQAASRARGCAQAAPLAPRLRPLEGFASPGPEGLPMPVAKGLEARARDAFCPTGRPRAAPHTSGSMRGARWRLSALGPPKGLGEALRSGRDQRFRPALSAAARASSTTPCLVGPGSTRGKDEVGSRKLSKFYLRISVLYCKYCGLLLNHKY